MHVEPATLYEVMGEPELSIKHAHKALAIRPDATSAKAVLERLTAIP